LAKRLDRFGGYATAIWIASHVSLHDNGFHPEATALGSYLPGTVDGLLAIDGNIASCLGQLDCCRCADAATGPGNERGFPVQFHARYHLPQRDYCQHELRKRHVNSVVWSLFIIL
jgi:hypothetical protein